MQPDNAYDFPYFASCSRPPLGAALFRVWSRPSCRDSLRARVQADLFARHGSLIVRLPADVKRISLDRKFAATGPYPPLGFVPFEERQLGNGDTFGLYWPIGFEDRHAFADLQ